MSNREGMLSGGVIAFIGAVAVGPAWASGGPDEEARLSLDKAVVVGEDARLEYSGDVPGAATAISNSKGATEELHCNYLSGPTHSGDKTFRFADGNRVVFSAAGDNRIRFITADGAKTQIEDGERIHRKSWWCQEDGVVLFRTVLAPGGNLGGVIVEWFDSRGTRRTETQVNLPPSSENVAWSYESARLVDDCLGLAFRVQTGTSRDSRPDSLKSAKLVEYKLCPKGI